jgi:transcriptional regulator
MSEVVPHELPIEPDRPPEGDTEAAESDDLQPTIDLGARQLKRRALDDLFQRAMNNQLPRSRALKSWEPDQLDERHLHAILLRAGGMAQKDIAAMMGWNDSWTSIVLNHPDAQYVLTRIISYASDNVIDIQVRIQAVAPEALDTVVEIMRTSQDEKLKSTNAFELLKMAGYGAKPTQAPQVQINNINQLPNQSIENLTKALTESRQIVAREYSVSAPSFIGSGSSESPAPSEASRSQNAGAPPVSDSQNDELKVRVA